MPQKKKRRIMSIDELYEFCLKNNFAHFSSNEFGKELMVRMNGNFEKTTKSKDKHKESLTPFVSRAFHDHVNLNKSEIPEESFNENVPSANFRPILAHLTTNSDGELDFGSHDFYVTTDENGNDKVIYEEQPIGVIDGTKTTIEYDEDSKVNRAVLHGYLYDEYCQDAIDVLNRRGTVDCSVELCIRELSFNTQNKTMSLDDFYVSGLTLLSKDVMPGMAGSNLKIEDFSINTEPLSFDKNNKLIELLESINEKLSNFNNTEHPAQKKPEEGGQNKNMKFEELLEKYGKTAEDITFDYENLSDEELEAKFAEMFEDENFGENEPENPSGGEDPENPEDPEPNQTFEKITRTYEISHEDIRYALYSLLETVESADEDWYFINAVYDDYFTYENWDGDKIFGQKYSKDGDNVAFDGERYNLHRELLTDSEFAELQSMRSNYASLKAFKETAEKNELHAQREKVLNDEKFAVIAEKDADGKFTNATFAELYENMDNYSLTDLEKEAKVILVDYSVEVGKFAANGNTNNGIKLFGNPNAKPKPKKRYGNLFE